MSVPVEDRSPSTSPDPFARAYYPVASAIGVVFVLIGAISLLIALRQLVLPSSDGGFGGPGFIGPSIEGSNAALRSFLGAIAFAVPGLLVLWWHAREGRRREGRADPGLTWSRSLYLHLVALISLVIATGAVVAMLHSLRDSVWPECFPSFSGDGYASAPLVSESPAFDDTLTPPPLISVEPPITIPIDPGFPGFEPEPECYPESPEALRSALDAGLVAIVSGGTWGWHLRRSRRGTVPQPSGE